jgi:hypothetical protein
VARSAAVQKRPISVLVSDLSAAAEPAEPSCARGQTGSSSIEVSTSSSSSAPASE